MEAPEQKNESFLQAAAGVIGSVYRAIMKDGTIAAFGRQGVSELGEALKAFPESIQVREVGTIFAPTQGEIANAREPEGLSPSEIARDNTPSRPDQDHGQDLGRGR